MVVGEHSFEREFYAKPSVAWESINARNYVGLRSEL